MFIFEYPGDREPQSTGLGLRSRQDIKRSASMFFVEVISCLKKSCSKVTI